MAHGNTLNTMRTDATGSDSEDDENSVITRSSVDSQATVLYDPIGGDDDNSISTAGSLIIDLTQAGLPVLPVQIPYQYEEQLSSEKLARMRLMLLLWDEYVKEHIRLDEFGTVNNAWSSTRG